MRNKAILARGSLGHVDAGAQGVIRCATVTPSKKKQTAFRIDADIMAGLQGVKDRDGIPISEQVRRALREWLTQKGMRRKPAKK